MVLVMSYLTLRKHGNVDEQILILSMIRNDGHRSRRGVELQLASKKYGRGLSLPVK